MTDEQRLEILRCVPVETLRALVELPKGFVRGAVDCKVSPKAKRGRGRLHYSALQGTTLCGEPAGADLGNAARLRLVRRGSLPCGLCVQVLSDLAAHASPWRLIRRVIDEASTRVHLEGP